MSEEQWEPTQIHIQLGDTITSKKGILFPTMKEGVMQACERVMYLGNGHWKVLGDKRRKVEAVEIKESADNGSYAKKGDD